MTISSWSTSPLTPFVKVRIEEKMLSSVRILGECEESGDHWGWFHLKRLAAGRTSPVLPRADREVTRGDEMLWGQSKPVPINIGAPKVQSKKTIQCRKELRLFLAWAATPPQDASANCCRAQNNDSPYHWIEIHTVLLILSLATKERFTPM